MTHVNERLGNIQLEAEEINVDLDDVEALLATTNTRLQEIENNTDGLEGLVSTGVATDAADQAVDNTAGGVTILAANGSRKSAIIQNTGTQTMRVTIDGTAPTTTKGTQLLAGASLVLSMPYCPVLAVKAIREGGSNTTASVTEVV